MYFLISQKKSAFSGGKLEAWFPCLQPSPWWSAHLKYQEGLPPLRPARSLQLHMLHFWEPLELQKSFPGSLGYTCCSPHWSPILWMSRPRMREKMSGWGAQAHTVWPVGTRPPQGLCSRKIEVLPTANQPAILEWMWSVIRYSADFWKEVRHPYFKAQCGSSF